MIIIDRFLSKIKINKNSCWEWTGYKNPYGYGRFSLNGKTFLAHRYIYEYYHGTICPDLTIDHLCRNRACCNVNHLEQVSMKMNKERGMSFAAINARKTHCPQGHGYSKENTICRISPTKKIWRRCKICTSKANHQYYLKIRMKH